MAIEEQAREVSTAPQYRIRKFEERDRLRIREICSDAAMEKPDPLFHIDREFAPMCFVDYYLEYEPESCFVGEVEGQIIGYIVGCKDTEKFRSIFRTRFLPRIMLRLVWRILTLQYRNKQTYTTLWWTVKSRFANNREKEIESITCRYPAHSHFNIDAAHRSKGLGHQFSLIIREHFREQGIRGQHAPIIEEAGQNALSNYLCSKRGYRIAVSRRHIRLEHMTGKPWYSKLLVYDLEKENDG